MLQCVVGKIQRGQLPHGTQGAQITDSVFAQIQVGQMDGPGKRADAGQAAAVERQALQRRKRGNGRKIAGTEIAVRIA